MNFKFKRHQPVKLLRDPDPEYVEYHNVGEDDSQHIVIKKGMKGRINIILPNGQYHVEIFDSKGNLVAYAPMGEEDLEALKEEKI